MVPRFIHFLQCDHMEELQHEAAWALTNIASGTTQNTDVIIRYGAIPIFVKLLSSPSNKIKEEALWALGNIAGDGPEYRDLVLSHDVLSAMLPLCHTKITTDQHKTLLRTLTWALFNCCRGEDTPPDWKYLILALKCLAILIKSDDEEILKDACWTYTKISDHDFEHFFNIIHDSGVLQRLIDLLGHESVTLRHPVINAIANFVAGDDEQTQKVIDMGILRRIPKLLMCSNEIMKRGACIIISNITGGTKGQIQEVINAELIPGLIHIMKNDKYQISKEALWAICNAISGGTDEQVSYLVKPKLMMLIQLMIMRLCLFYMI